MKSGWKWAPRYSYDTKDGTKHYWTEDVDISECPVSYVTPESFELCSLVGEGSRAHESAGASLFGPDLSGWDARVVDALLVIDRCRQTERAAYCQALHQQRD